MTSSSRSVIAVIGAGNMGSSLIGGLIHHQHPSDKIWATDPSNDRIQEINKTFGIHTTTNNLEAIKTADVIILAIKPQIFSEVLPELAPIIQTRRPLIISIAAGVQEASIQHWLQGNLSIIRAMPNTPALIGCGATALYANKYTTNHERELAESIMKAVGITTWVQEENTMDIVTALSGSGPAYFLIIMEVLEHAAQQLGLDKDIAHRLTLQTALGAATMASQSDVSLSELRQRVTSKGGTTERAISILEQNHIRELFFEVLKGAKTRSEELAQEQKNNAK